MSEMRVKTPKIIKTWIKKYWKQRRIILQMTFNRRETSLWCKMNTSKKLSLEENHSLRSKRPSMMMSIHLIVARRTMPRYFLKKQLVPQSRLITAQEQVRRTRTRRGSLWLAITHSDHPPYLNSQALMRDNCRKDITLRTHHDDQAASLLWNLLTAALFFWDIIFTSI